MKTYLIIENEYDKEILENETTIAKLESSNELDMQCFNPDIMEKRVRYYAKILETNKKEKNLHS